MREIQTAVIDNFFTFDLFDNTKGDIRKKYFDILKKIVDSQFLISSANESKKVGFQNNFLEELKRRSKLSEINDLTNLMKKDFISVKGDTFVFVDFEKPPHITEKNKNVDILNYSQCRALSHYIRALESEETYTGVATLSVKNNFLLYPIRIETTTGEVFYIDVYFTIFKHGYGILNTSIRIKDEDIDQLNQKIWDIGIKAAFLPNFMFNIDIEEEKKFEYKKIGGCKTIFESINRYMDILKKTLDIKSTHTFRFDCMTILEMKNQPDNFENERDSLYPQIYKLLFAPVINFALNNKTAKVRVDEYSKQPDNNLKLFINSRRFIMIVGNNIYKMLKDDPEEMQKEIVYSSYRADMIFALEKLFLKNITLYKYLGRLSNPAIPLNKMYTILLNRDMELRYETNQLFYNYATTREYIDFFIEKGLEKGVQNAIEESIDRVKNLILLRRENRTNQITIVTTILALIFTVLFSVPGLKDTLGILGVLNTSNVVLTYVIVIFLVLIIIIWCYKDFLIITPYHKAKNFFYSLEIKIRQFFGKKFK